jgi:hypothetical protein
MRSASWRRTHERSRPRDRQPFFGGTPPHDRACARRATYLVVEVIGGLWSGSSALLANAGHMLTDVAGLGLALLAIRFSEKPATRHERTATTGRDPSGADQCDRVGADFCVRAVRSVSALSRTADDRQRHRVDCRGHRSARECSGHSSPARRFTRELERQRRVFSKYSRTSCRLSLSLQPPP